MTMLKLGDLPDDCLLEIFKFLDQNTLLRAFLVDKRWNNLLSSSIEISKKIKYIFTTYNLERTAKSGTWKNIQLERKMTNIKILQLVDDSAFGYRYHNKYRDSSILNSAVVKLLSENNEWLDTLHIDAIDDEFNLVQVLSAANRVRVLKIGGKFQKFHFHSNLPKVKYLPRMKRLDSLEIHVSCNNIFYYFTKSQIENLFINTRITIKHKKLKAFFKTQSRLKRLTIECDTLQDFFLEDLSSDENPFQLKHFSISSVCVVRITSTKARNNFMTFLKTHCEQLETLNLKIFPYPDILLFITNNLKSLKKLVIYDDFGTKHEPLPGIFGTLENVETLELTSAFMYDKTIHEMYTKNLLKTFPNVEKFSIIKINPETLEFISKSFGNSLKELKLLYFPKIPANANIIFPKLKIVKVQYIKSDDILNFVINFFQRNPNIEIFHAQPLDFRLQTWSRAIEKLKSATNLKKVIIRDIEY